MGVQGSKFVVGVCVVSLTTTTERNMSDNSDFVDFFPDSKAEYVLSNVAEVVERILTFIPTKSLLQLAR